MTTLAPKQLAHLLLSDVREVELEGPTFARTMFATPLDRMGKNRRARLRVFLSVDQGMKCYYCRKNMCFAKPDHPNSPAPNSPTFEHLVDEWMSAAGKDNDLENIVISCYACNHGRNKLRQHAALVYFQKCSGKTRKQFMKEIVKRKMSATDLIMEFGLPKIMDIKPLQLNRA